MAHKDKNNDDHMTSKQMKANIDNVYTEHDKSSEQCFNTPVIAKTLPTCENANRRETNDVRRHNIEKLLTELNSTPMKKDESNNPYVEFRRINEVSYQNISSTYNKSETETLGDKRNTDTILLNEIYKSRLEYSGLWKKGQL